MKTLPYSIIKYRWLIIGLFTAITIFFAAQLPKSRMNPDMITYMPETMQSIVHKKQIEELFGGMEMVMVMVQTNDVLNAGTLKRVKAISHDVRRIKGVDKVMSLFDLKHIRGDAGAMLVDPAVKRIPRSETEREQLRDNIRDNDIVFGNVVSEDFRTTAVIGTIVSGTSDKELIDRIKEIIEAHPGPEKVLLGGTPYQKLNVATNTSRDIGLLMPIGLLIMLVFLFFCFRGIRGVLLPFLVVVMSIIVTMGLMPLLEWKLTAVSIILPVLLIAVANDYGIHLIACYQELNTPGNNLSRREMAARMLNGLGGPILLAGITTMIGLLCLLNHILIPAEQLGILSAVGIFFALAASLLFIPAVSSLVPKAKPIVTASSKTGKRPLLESILQRFSRLVSRYPRSVVLGALVMTALISTGIGFIRVNTNSVAYFPKDHPVQQSAALVNNHLGGFFPVSVVIKGDIKEPATLKMIDELEKEIKTIEHVGNTSSIARVVRQMSRVLNEKGQPGYDGIPDTYNAVSQYFELYMMSGDPDDFEKLVDFPFEHAVINARITSTNTPDLRKVVAQIKELVKDNPKVAYIGGMAEIFSELDVNVVRGQFLSLGMALLLVTLLLMVVFRSITAGLLSIIPLALSTLILFGLMGLLGIELNMATALLTSIMIGVGIDYTIHFLWRYRDERASGKPHIEAVEHTLLTSGRGIVFNALSVVIGFLALLASGFVPVRFFGFLVIISVFSCLLGAIIVIPSLCLLIKPRFLEPDQQQQGNASTEITSMIK